VKASSSRPCCFKSCANGDPLPGDWWRIEDGGDVVGFGWLDVVWGEAEIQLATAPSARGRGVGTFAVEHLEAEARARGVNYVYNTVRASHPDAAGVTAWLVKRGFEPSADGSLLRAVAREP